ncbi:MAG: type IV toxin-antitoxin system AbiEi family antitoxin domain-containing protein [Actinomycetota bacterium]
MAYRNGTSATHEAFDVRLARFAARRYGVFTFEEAIRLGATQRVIARRLAAGRWTRFHRGVYSLSGVPGSWRQSLLVACLAAGAGAGSSHRAAAPLWRLAGFESGPLEITVPRGRRPRLSHVRVHHLALPAVDLTVVDAIPVTTPVRTLLDLAAVLPTDGVEEALDDALRRGLVTVRRLRWRLEELGRRPGVTTMRRLIETRSHPAETPESILETRFLRLLRRRGLPEPIAQYRIRDGGRLVAIVDFAYPERMLAVEVDGYRWHSSRIRWQDDLRRRSELARLGWRVIHVTADDLKHRPEQTVALIARALTPQGRRGDAP